MIKHIKEKYISHLRKKWEIAYKDANTFQKFHAERDVECQARWKKFRKLDKKLYKYDQKNFIRKWKTLPLDPYGYFATIPEAISLLIERFYEYWSHGYNVHVDDTDDEIKDSITEAYQLAQNIDTNDLYEGKIEFEEYQKNFMKLLSYIAKNFWKWGD